MAASFDIVDINNLDEINAIYDSCLFPTTNASGKLVAIRGDQLFKVLTSAANFTKTNGFSGNYNLKRINNLIFGSIVVNTDASTTISAWTKTTLFGAGTIPSNFRPKSNVTFAFAQQNGGGQIYINTDGSIQYTPWTTVGKQYAIGGQFMYEASSVFNN